MSSTEKEYLVEFGKAFKTLRLKLSNKSLRLLAYESDIHPSVLSRLESGKRMPNLFTLKKLANCLNMSIDELLREIENNIPENIKNIDD